MIVPMPRLFEACAKVLRSRMCPVHYADLTREGLEVLDVSVTAAQLVRLKEDVREKMLLAGQCGSAYVPAPCCYGILRGWFPGAQPDLFNVDAYNVLIRSTATWSQHALTEALLRRPHLHTKVMDCYHRWEGAARGFLIQEHISRWFRTEWPRLWQPPDNQGRWDRWCDHDFKLCLGESTLKVDAMGPRGDGTFGLPQGGGKHPVDIHLAASVRDPDYLLHGYVRGKDLRESFAAENTRPIAHLIVRLNCHESGVDYRAIAASLARQHAS